MEKRVKGKNSTWRKKQGEKIVHGEKSKRRKQYTEKRVKGENSAWRKD